MDAPPLTFDGTRRAWPDPGPKTIDVPVIDESALLHTFSEFARALVAPYDVGPVLYRLVDQCIDVLGVDAAGISLGSDDGTALVFVAATHPGVAAIEGEEVDLDEGPCHEAFRTGQQVAVDDLADEHRWRSYCGVAAEHEVHAVLGVPMPVTGQRIGALNLYRREPHHWDDEEREVAQLLADMGTGYILNGAELAQARSVSDRLQHALDGRIVVEQAKGVLVERHDLVPAAAFAWLREQARSTHTPTPDLARQVVEGDLDM